MSPDTIHAFAVPPLVKTVTVRCSPAKAFRHFTEGMGAWWPVVTHHVAPEPESCTFEPRLGGRLYERGKNGVETKWGSVLAWDPPKRLVFSWELSCSQELRDAKVEVIFVAVPDGTEVKLVHTGWEHMGAEAIPMRERFNAGWARVFERCYVEYANKAT